MPYIMRESGVIVGAFHRPQLGIPKEYLPEGHPDVVAFRAPPPPPTKQEQLDQKQNDILRAFVKAVAPHLSIPVSQLVDEIKALMP